MLKSNHLFQPGDDVVRSRNALGRQSHQSLTRNRFQPSNLSELVSLPQKFLHWFRSSPTRLGAQSVEYVFADSNQLLVERFRNVQSSLASLSQTLTNPQRIPPQIQNGINVDHIVFRLIIDAEWESLRQHPMESKVDWMDTCKKN